ncbi:uncharacterized protein LOC133283580 [Gastrolobium bilobum]|uniref:uncharacterized protein LOC133283580 n=1 Tax=Gastrolobium bilobum TaxID=150636 RepID=UPI002AB1BFBD|nr:uncharacterized protein LOC133283580 [Gastrolobium bilobum]
MEIVDDVLYLFAFSVMLCSIVCCDVDDGYYKPSPTVISLINQTHSRYCLSFIHTMAEGSQQSQKRSNHTWTAEEDKVLIECLSEIGPCWRGDNDFKAGYSSAMEKMMHQRIPGCSLRSIPHITSRVKLLKKQYNAIHEMVGGNGGSGFGWNDAKKMIDVEKEIFDEWVKSHPTAKGLYNKPFLHYEALGTIFGKDVASGGNAECPQESVNHLERDHAFLDESGTVFDDYLDLT